MRCPKCGSNHTQFVSNTKTTGPSIVDGCCGWILFGPVGLLCSFCGTDSETEEYWICHSCGTKFQEGEYEAKLRNKTDNVVRLKQEIALLESNLEGKPQNWKALLQEAKQNYENAEQYYKEKEDVFVQSSDFLKFMRKLNNLIGNLIILIFLFGIIMFFVSLFGEGKLGWAFAFVIVSIICACILFYIADSSFSKAKRYINWQKAAELEEIKEDIEKKKEIYKKFQKIQDNVNSHEQKLAELDAASNDLKYYTREDK